MYVYRKNFVFLHECLSASVGNTINHALPRLHDIEAISRDTTFPSIEMVAEGVKTTSRKCGGKNVSLRPDV
jgi:hypothetical protein